MTGGPHTAAPRECVPIALVGLRGAGKSAVGAALARRLGRPIVDTDLVLAARGRAQSAGALLGALGEPAFRDREAEVLAEALARADLPVVATGGGCVERRGSRALLRARARCVWLCAPVATLAARVVADSAARPALLGGGDAASELAALEARRSAWYSEVAEVEVDAGGGDVAAISGRVAAALGLD